MGSGSSAQKETQSAPATARATPKQAPKRNRQFEEVQIAQGGANPRSRGQSRSQGPSPNPPQGTSRTPRGQDRQDPSGASGSTSDRRGQPVSSRQGAAANGKKPQSQEKNTSGGKMPAQQDKDPPDKTPATLSLRNNQPINGRVDKINKKLDENSNKNDKIVTTKPPVNPRNQNAPPQTINMSNNKELKNKENRDFVEKGNVQFKGQPAKQPQKAQDKTTDIVDSMYVGNRKKTGQEMAAGINGKEPVVNGIDEDNLSYDRGDDEELSDENETMSEGHEEMSEGHEEMSEGHGHGDSHGDSFYSDNENVVVEKENGKPQAKKQRGATSVSMKEEDIVFETFYHRSGKEFQCIYQSGMRFYLDDWGSKEWQPFPKRWYNEGLLVTNTILKDDSQPEQGGSQSNDQAGGASGQGQSSRSRGHGSRGGGGDDREGFLMHPTKGRVPTYIFYKKHNVHMYFDKDTGSWVRMPIGWELHHNMVKSLVDQVEEAVPTWGDRHDILSLLRACNYDPDECISIYLHLERDEWMKAPKTAKEGKALAEKESRMAELEQRVREMEIELQKERTTREEAERNLEELTEKNTEQEAEFKEMEAHLSAATGGRPMTARPISRMVKPGKGPVKGNAAVKGGKGPVPVPIQEKVNPDDILDLNANAKELRKAHARLKVDVERYMGDLKHIMEKVGPTVKKMKVAEKSSASEIEEVRALYRKEALQRKILYNQLQEMRGNIRVFCRVRKDDRAENCLRYPSDQDIIATHAQQGKKMFNFDKVFEPSSTQEQVFEDTKPIITSCADGYNVCLLAYGQTGSGKTFTMMGPDSNPGINIRAMKELFQVCEARSETMSYQLTVSLVEIYNETIQDLLTTEAKTLELRTAGNKVNIPGLTEYPIKNVKDVQKVMAMGDTNRSVAETKMNSTSSRSHLVLMLSVEGHDKVTSAISKGTLVLCDLAGSERISKTEAEGQRLVEAAAINKSLSALGQVFTALRSSQLHVPYRNSKLTQILQPSLGGDAKACLFVNVSPDSYNFLETVSTLTFGNNARQVALGQAKQNISKGKN